MKKTAEELVFVQSPNKMDFAETSSESFQLPVYTYAPKSRDGD